MGRRLKEKKERKKKKQQQQQQPQFGQLNRRSCWEGNKFTGTVYSTIWRRSGPSVGKGYYRRYGQAGGKGGRAAGGGWVEEEEKVIFIVISLENAMRGTNKVRHALSIKDDVMDKSVTLVNAIWLDER